MILDISLWSQTDENMSLTEEKTTKNNIPAKWFNLAQRIPTGAKQSISKPSTEKNHTDTYCIKEAFSPKKEAPSPGKEAPSSVLVI